MSLLHMLWILLIPPGLFMEMVPNELSPIVHSEYEAPIFGEYLYSPTKNVAKCVQIIFTLIYLFNQFYAKHLPNLFCESINEKTAKLVITKKLRKPSFLDDLIIVSCMSKIAVARPQDLD